MDEASARERQLAAEHDELTHLLSDLPVEIAGLRERESEARDAQRDLPGVRDAVGSIRSRREAAGLAVRLDEELAEATDLHRRAIDEAQQLREFWLQVQEHRIRGIAAELAVALVVGDECPVCGSADHPRPASADTGAPDAATEKAARKQVDDAEAARHAHDVRVRELTGRLEAARASADGDLASLREALATAESGLQRLTSLAEAAEERRAALIAAESRLSELTARRDKVGRDLAVTATTLERQRHEAVTIEGELSSLLSGSGCDTLTDLAAAHEEVATTCTQALLARDEARRTDQAAAAARAQLEEAAVAAGFEDADAALEAVLDPPSLARLEREIRAHDQAVAGTESTLSDPALLDQALLPPPDVPALEAVLQQAVDQLEAATTAANIGRTRAQRFAGLVDQLAAALEAWSPVRAELDLVTRLAALVDG
ncbi:MAG: hypothetical protein ACRDOX_14765, partial [Nocardioides sp.]